MCVILSINFQFLVFWFSIFCRVLRQFNETFQGSSLISLHCSLFINIFSFYFRTSQEALRKAAWGHINTIRNLKIECLNAIRCCLQQMRIHSCSQACTSRCRRYRRKLILLKNTFLSPFSHFAYYYEKRIETFHNDNSMKLFCRRIKCNFLSPYYTLQGKLRQIKRANWAHEFCHSIVVLLSWKKGLKWKV